MNVNLNILAATIIEVARHEELLLSRVGKGIFFMPEVAFAYAVGLKLAMRAELAFGTGEAKWYLEKTIAGGHPTDLVFEVNNGLGLAIEFKRWGNPDDYESDLKKLEAIDSSKYTKVFCALVNVRPDLLSKDNRIQSVENREGPLKVRRLTKDFDFFSTVHDSFKTIQICCLIGIWEVEASKASAKHAIP